jgi:hypothetical protein
MSAPTEEDTMRTPAKSRTFKKIERWRDPSPGDRPKKLLTRVLHVLRRDRGRSACPAPCSVAAARTVLEQAARTELDALIRFYLEGQAPEAICANLGFSAAEFLAIKQKARAHFFELQKQNVHRVSTLLLEGEYEA